ncbi:hypothetical protein K490DRAFT_61294 [Saccharata proteae CBS 121410]|uniref:Uncharacterized protein n=1 Tax=Saccharata proteae CBS 121410 TaxID=1314787 RepID=A0A9P4M243_9PEZI|nr:hypothetical protein K490DRAFT_61294 [Saccharata proteae CBS 121410]
MSCRELRISIETQGSTVEYIDSYLGTSFLLFQNAWGLEQPSGTTTSDKDSLFLSDRILPYSKGLKSLIIATLSSCGMFGKVNPAMARLTPKPIMARQEAREQMLAPSWKKSDLEKVSVLLPRMIYFRSLKRILDYYLKHADTTQIDQGISVFQFGEEFEQRLLEWLDHVWHCRRNTGGSSDVTDEISIEDFIDAGRRLFPILVMLKIRRHVTPQSPEDTGHESQLFEGPSWVYMKHVIARYLFLWPIKIATVTCPVSDDINVPATGAKYAKQVLWLYYCITLRHSVMNNGDEDMTNGPPPYWWSVHRVEGMLRALWTCVTAGNNEGVGGGCEACLSLALDLSTPEISTPSSANSDNSCAPWKQRHIEDPSVAVDGHTHDGAATPPADAPPPMTPDNGSSTLSTRSGSYSHHRPALPQITIDASYPREQHREPDIRRSSGFDAEADISPTTRVHDWLATPFLTHGSDDSLARPALPTRSLPGSHTLETQPDAATTPTQPASSPSGIVSYPILPPIPTGTVHIPSAPLPSWSIMPSSSTVSVREQTVTSRSVSPHEQPRMSNFEEFPPFVRNPSFHEQQSKDPIESRTPSPWPKGVLGFQDDFGPEFERAYDIYRGVLRRKDVTMSLELFRALEAVRRAEMERRSCYARFEALAEGFGVQDAHDDVRHDSLKWSMDFDDVPKRVGSAELKRAIDESAGG